eukprot:362467-Chlamydomonas_euryale.AAC.3
MPTGQCASVQAEHCVTVFNRISVYSFDAHTRPHTRTWPNMNLLPSCLLPRERSRPACSKEKEETEQGPGAQLSCAHATPHARDATQTSRPACSSPVPGWPCHGTGASPHEPPDLLAPTRCPVLRIGTGHGGAAKLTLHAHMTLPEDPVTLVTFACEPRRGAGGRAARHGRCSGGFRLPFQRRRRRRARAARHAAAVGVVARCSRDAASGVGRRAGRRLGAAQRKVGAAPRLVCQWQQRGRSCREAAARAAGAGGGDAAAGGAGVFGPHRHHRGGRRRVHLPHVMRSRARRVRRVCVPDGRACACDVSASQMGARARATCLCPRWARVRVRRVCVPDGRACACDVSASQMGVRARATCLRPRWARVRVRRVCVPDGRACACPNPCTRVRVPHECASAVMHLPRSAAWPPDASVLGPPCHAPEHA